MPELPTRSLPRELTAEELAALEALDFDELRRRFEERLREQDERHDGGNRWIGTGDTSPFGHGGTSPAGIRVGGAVGDRRPNQPLGRAPLSGYEFVELSYHNSTKPVL